MLYDKIYGCLCGGVIGDAIGAPVEGMHYSDIERRYGWIDSFSGIGTDDSAIKQILCAALLQNDGHITADEWAQSFLRNRENYYPLFYIPVQNMFHKIDNALTLPVYAGLGNMPSSSSAMSIAPLGIVNACDPRRAAIEAYDAAGLIHAGDTTFCRDGACAVAAAVAEAFKPDATVESVIRAGYAYLHPLSARVMIDLLSEIVALARETNDYIAFRGAFYARHLRKVISDSRETVPCAFGLFLLSGGDGRKALEYSANFGRDADTIGTMLGALCGALRGSKAFPSAWLAALEEGYGTRQAISKDEYSIATREFADQRVLAKELEGLVLRRFQEHETILGQISSILRTEE